MSFISKRIVQKACLKYYKRSIPSLICALVDFIQIYTPSNDKFLTNPHKNLLIAVIGASKIHQKQLIETINEIQNGPLSQKWREMFADAINYSQDNAEYDIGASFNSKSVPVEHSGDITLPDVSLDIQEEIRNLKGVVQEIKNESMKSQSDSTARVSTMKKPLLRQKHVDDSFLQDSYGPQGPSFKNVLSSTVDEELENAINVFWRAREGNLEKVQKVVIPKMPPKRGEYPVKHHFLQPEKRETGLKQKNINYDGLQAMVDELEVYKNSYDWKIKDHKWPHKAKMQCNAMTCKR